MDPVQLNIIAIVLAFLITVGSWKLFGFDKNYFNSDKILVPALFGIGAFVLFFILRFLLGSFS